MIVSKWPQTAFCVEHIYTFVLAKYSVFVCLCASCLETHNERVHDPLKKKPANGDGALRVREHPPDGPYVESKTVFFCTGAGNQQKAEHMHYCGRTCLSARFTTTMTGRIFWHSAIAAAPQGAQP